MNIVLTGYRCCGKSSVGRYIAQKTGRKFIDTDDLIEKKAGIKIEEIIANYGWEYFRKLEKDAVREISNEDNIIIATGGGVVTNDENVFNLRKNGFVVWLDGDADIIRDRMSMDEEKKSNVRPSLTGENPADEIAAVMAAREPLYEQASDMKIDTSRLSIAEAAEQIIEEI